MWFKASNCNCVCLFFYPDSIKTTTWNLEPFQLCQATRTEEVKSFFLPNSTIPLHFYDCFSFYRLYSVVYLFERELYSLLTRKRQRFNLEVSTAWQSPLILIWFISISFLGRQTNRAGRSGAVCTSRRKRHSTRKQERERERARGRNRGAGATVGWRLCVAIMLSAITRMKWGCQPANIAVVHHQVRDMTRRILKESWSVWKRGAVERRGSL